MKYLLDASAVLAALKRESGWERVISMTPEAAIGAANLAEVVARLSEVSDSPAAIVEAFATLAITVLPVEETDGIAAGLLRKPTRHLGLSSGDRLCLAMAGRLGVTAVAADRAFAPASVPANVEVELIR